MVTKFRMLNDKEVKNFLLAVCAGAYGLAIYNFVYPHEPSDSGRWGWLFSFLYKHFGLYSIPVFWLVVGAILVLAERSKIKSSRS